MDRLIFSAILILAASSVLAEDLSDALHRCRTLEDEAERLTCFDQASQSIEAGSEAAVPAALEPAPAELAPAATAAPAVTETPVTAPDLAPASAASDVTAPAASAAITEDEFGLQRKREQEGVQKITSRHDGMFTGWEGDTLFPLENGQVWKQIESGRYSYKADRPMIEVKRGILQSYYLKVRGENRTVRVTRIR